MFNGRVCNFATLIALSGLLSLCRLFNSTKVQAQSNLFRTNTKGKGPMAFVLYNGSSSHSYLIVIPSDLTQYTVVYLIQDQ